MLDPTGQNISVGLTDIQEVLVNGQDLGLGGYLDIGLIDTIEDLFVNFIGAAVFSVAGYFCIRHPERKKMIEGFIPTPAGVAEVPESGPVTEGQNEEAVLAPDLRIGVAEKEIYQQDSTPLL